MEYGVEIWKYQEMKELEKIKIDYYRWVLGLDFCTPRYIVYKETGNMKLKVEWAIRSLRYEYRLQRLDKERLVRKCWEESLKEEENSGTRGDKDKYLNSLGLSQAELERMREKEINVFQEIRRRETDIGNQVIKGKIREARYNTIYKKLCEEGLPRYLKEGNKNKNIKSIARIRCGNVERANKYWLNEERL